jgi:ActR/RegA family two-component response regulator
MSPILVLEDEYFIAADGVAEVQKRGFRAIAVGNLADALELAQTEQLDGALVDLNLCGEMAFPVIELLRRQNDPGRVLHGLSSNRVTARTVVSTAVSKAVAVGAGGRQVDAANEVGCYATRCRRRFHWSGPSGQSVVPHAQRFS